MKTMNIWLYSREREKERKIEREKIKIKKRMDKIKKRERREDEIAACGCFLTPSPFAFSSYQPTIIVLFGVVRIWFLKCTIPRSRYNVTLWSHNGDWLPPCHCQPLAPLSILFAVKENISYKFDGFLLLTNPRDQPEFQDCIKCCKLNLMICVNHCNSWSSGS